MIECIDVSYSYHGNQEKATTSCKGGTLKNINCKIEKGTFVLLCGALGCGKTTLTRWFHGLILNYYDGELSGQVLLDGKEYKSLSLFDISEKLLLYFKIREVNSLTSIQRQSLLLALKIMVYRKMKFLIE